MAINTANEKLSMMEWCSVWEPGLPISPGAIGVDDQFQFIWDYLFPALVPVIGSGDDDLIYFIINHWHRRN